MPDTADLTGLTSEAAERLHQDGKGNVPPQSGGSGTGQILLRNLLTWFNILNLLLALALLMVQSYRNMLFMGVVILNTLISTVQEVRAKRTIDRLTVLVEAPLSVLRDGSWTKLAPAQLVLGDLVEFSLGDQICADACVVAGSAAVNESLLTGESDPIVKQAGDELLSGSYLTEGRVVARLSRVGQDSYAGALVHSMRKVKVVRSRLMEDLKRLIRLVSLILVPLGVTLFLKQFFWLREPLESAVPSSVAAMIGMIPEGLMLLTSMTLAIGVIRLGQQGTLVQELYGIENLARVDVLCVDKTGTITEGQLQVEDVVPLGTADRAQIDQVMQLLLRETSDDNATFQALRTHWRIESNGPVANQLRRVPFSSSRRWSAVCPDLQRSYLIGAPEILSLPGRHKDIEARIQQFAAAGLRVLMLAAGGAMDESLQLPHQIQPLALILLNDSIRPDFPPTAAYLAREGVAVKVISGDNPLTVAEVARRAGLSGADQWIDLSACNGDDALREAAAQYTVFGRVTPEQKKKLILILQEAGHTVAMVGDGVNDVPALKVCDCAIAMAGGSEAARRVSQLTLLKENFSALPVVILEGRRVINNITRSASLFLVKTCFSFLLTLMVLFLPLAYPFRPIQLTLISVFTVGIPSFFLALEPNRERVRGNFLTTILGHAIPGALTNFLLVLAVFFLSGWFKFSPDVRSTLAVAVVGFTGLLVLVRTSRPLNRLRGVLLLAMSCALLLTALVFGAFFFLVPLSATAIAVLLGLLVSAPFCLIALARLTSVLSGYWRRS